MSTALSNQSKSGTKIDNDDNVDREKVYCQKNI